MGRTANMPDDFNCFDSIPNSLLRGFMLNDDKDRTPSFRDEDLNWKKCLSEWNDAIICDNQVTVKNTNRRS